MSMAPGECALILNESPDLVIGQDLTESNHGSTGRAVFYDPEEFSLGAMPPKSMMLEIAGQGIQLGSRRSITGSIRSMTSKASALAVVHRFALLNHLRGIQKRTLESASFSQLINGHSWLHHLSFYRQDRSGERRDRNQQREHLYPHHWAPFIVVAGCQAKLTRTAGPEQRVDSPAGRDYYQLEDEGSSAAIDHTYRRHTELPSFGAISECHAPIALSDSFDIVRYPFDGSPDY
jgi:hypothetical protein